VRTAATADALTREAVEAFLFREARLADESRYDEWLALWTEDLTYWVPANADEYDPDEHVSILYDNRERLQDRIARLKSGGAWSQEPQSRMRRLVSNIEIEPADRPDERIVISNFVLGELRRGRDAAYFAQQKHRLRQTAGGLRMAAKTVYLVKNNEPLHNLSFII
jgi:3-phenylpropionate/cinnamic acid dioxygenase small subunit